MGRSLENVGGGGGGGGLCKGRTKRKTSCIDESKEKNFL